MKWSECTKKRHKQKAKGNKHKQKVKKILIGKIRKIAEEIE